METAQRGRTLTIFAVLFALLSISNFLKPLELHGAGFVLFGRRLSGTPNAIAGPLFGAFLLTYAIGIWNMRRWAVPMAYAYATYVIANLALFRLRNTPPPGAGPMIFGLVYIAVAVGVSSGAAYLLSRRRDALS